MPMPEDQDRYPELKISVLRDGTVVAWTPERERDDGKIDPDELLLETVKAFRDWLNQQKLQIQRERDLILLGKLLYRLLFSAGGPNVRDLVVQKLKEARSSKKRICIQLAFHESRGELASLPWEFLYDPVNACFFATDIDLVLTRFVSGAGERRSLRCDDLPLRLLIVVSKPKGLPTVASVTEIEAVETFARENAASITLDEPLVNKNYLELQRWLEDAERRPHIVHFIGHGRYNKAKRQGEVALVNMNGSGEAEWVDQDRFKRLFVDAGCIPRLVLLQLCEGAVVEEAELIASFEGLAPTLISADVQAVVAMQFPITNVNAGRISTKFYEELMKRKSVGQAVQAARRMIATYDPIAGGTPVLYMYGYDGVVVNPSNAGQQAGGENPQPGAHAAATGRPMSEPAPAPARARPSAPPPNPPLKAPAGSSSSPPTNGGLPIAMNTVLDAGDRKIKDLKLEEQESMALNKKLFLSVSGEFRGKSLLEIKQVIGELYEHETDAQFRTVLEEMLGAAGRMS